MIIIIIIIIIYEDISLSSIAFKYTQLGFNVIRTRHTAKELSESEITGVYIQGGGVQMHSVERTDLLHSAVNSHRKPRLNQNI
jgi:hypothetical protein